jgi:hypothetical protein
MAYVCSPSERVVDVVVSPDRWLMHAVAEHSSSNQAREAAAAWLAAYDTAVALGSSEVEALAHADVAYRAAAVRTGLPHLHGQGKAA